MRGKLPATVRPPPANPSGAAACTASLPLCCTVPQGGKISPPVPKLSVEPQRNLPTALHCHLMRAAHALWPSPIQAGSVTVPSLASVLNEFGLKKHMETSVLLQVSTSAAASWQVAGPNTCERVRDWCVWSVRLTPCLPSASSALRFRVVWCCSSSSAVICCPSLHPQNFFLYFFGTMFNLAGLLVVVATGGLAPGAVFSGFSAVGCASAGWARLVGGGSGHRRLAWTDQSSVA